MRRRPQRREAAGAAHAAILKNPPCRGQGLRYYIRAGSLHIVLRTTLRSSVKRPRISTAFEVMVSMLSCIRLPEVRPAEVRPAEVRLPKVRPAEVRRRRSPEVRALVRFGSLRCAPLRSPP